MPQIVRVVLPKGTKVPDHIALILDGNRRWARARGLAPWEGHKAGYQAVRKLARAARELGVHTFTIWAFSTENWERPRQEINAILDLLRSGLKEFVKEAHKEKVRLVHLGRKDRLPEDIAQELARVEESTKKYAGHTLNLALDYGGRDEIVRAAKKIVEAKVPAEKIDEKLFESYLDTHDQPYPYVDLFIRTSGEQRTSGLLPWQMAYTEYYWEPNHLPDMTPEKLKEAILDYSRRRRRFGGNDAVEHLKFKPKVVAKLELGWWRLQHIPEGTRFRDYAMKHLKEQYGLSKSLAREAAKYMMAAVIEGEDSKWDKSMLAAKKFYKLIKDEIKLAFEPSLAASLQVKLWQGMKGKETIYQLGEAEDAAKELYAEVYRISLFQAAKAAHLRILANVERNLAEKGYGKEHWVKAEDYLQKFYKALKERVA